MGVVNIQQGRRNNIDKELRRRW